MNRSILALSGIVLLLTTATSAQPNMPPAPGVEKKIVNIETHGGMGDFGMGMGGMRGMMPDLPPDVERKIVQQRIKFARDNAKLMGDIAAARMEMRLVWLDEKPSADKVIAKMRELNRLQLQLRENRINQQFAIQNLLPENMKKDFLRGGCGKMGMGNDDCQGMCHNPGPGRMGMSDNMRRIKIMTRECCPETNTNED